MATVPIRTNENRDTLPVEAPFLPFSAPCFGIEEEQELLQALKSDWITTGPRCKTFESVFAEYTGSKYAIALNSCTAALHLALASQNIGVGNAVITSPLTFTATANVIVHQGAQPLFVDVDPDTYNLDPVQLHKFIDSQCVWNAKENILRVRATQNAVRAIIAVHYGGHPCAIDEINEMAARFGLSVIEDAAHALGGVYRGRNVGTLGDVACFSFYPTKNISTGEGGMLTTNDPDLAQRARVLSLHGITKDAWKRYSKEGSWQYDVTEAGFKYNMTDLAAALGLQQMHRLPSLLSRRAEIAQLYAAMLADLPLQHPTVMPDVTSAWHLYPVQILSSSVTREDVIQQLRKQNIGASVHFIPVHLMSFYQQQFGFKRGDFPVAEQVFDKIVSLPFFPRMSDDDVARVAGAMSSILERWEPALAS
ncbi:MAG: pseC [Candidatus Angelobacter sp.]|jgi:dTDP-4-amino-4,6-dideoxygalactose transaminase|nr:pseC [Candidatus Angelobacter sp.]